MSSRIVTLLKNDFLLLFRYGIIAAYSVVVAFYVGAFIYASNLMPNWMVGMIIIMEPTVFGFFFLGGLIQLEKSEDVRAALAITPISAMDYFIAKATSLTLIGLLAVLILVNFTHSNINYPMLISALVLTSVQFIAIGVLAALYFKTLSSYLMGAVTFLMPILLLGMLAFFNPPAWTIIIPTVSQFKLIVLGAGSGTTSTLEIILMFIVLIITLMLSVFIAIKALEKELGRK